MEVKSTWEPPAPVARLPQLAAHAALNNQKPYTLMCYIIYGVPPPTHHRFRNVVFEITATDVGVFEVSGRFLGRQIEKVELVFQVRATILM